MNDQPKRTLRFWDDVRVDITDEGSCVLLDGRPLKLPGGGKLALSSHALAEAIAVEWRMAGGGKRGQAFDATDIPLTRIAGTMVERIPHARDHTINTLAGYVQTDLLCYRAQSPALLVSRQNEAWSPLVHWFDEFASVSLRVTHGIMPVSQATETFARTRDILVMKSDGILAGLGVAVPALGSIVLGLALAEDRISATQAVACATLDERTQMELWGEDSAQESRIEALAADIMEASRFMTLARS